MRKERSAGLVMALAEAKAKVIVHRLSIGDYVKEAEPTILFTFDKLFGLRKGLYFSLPED